MAYYDTIVRLLVALVLLNPVYSSSDQADQQYNSNAKTVNLDIQSQKSNEVGKNTDWIEVSERIATGLKAFFKPYTDWFNSGDYCSRNANFGIQTAISRGAASYVSCVKEASSKIISRNNGSADSVQSRTIVSIIQFTTDCFSRILSMNVFNLVQGCSQDFILNAMTFMNESSNDVRQDMKVALNDSIKVAKCADDTMSEAAKTASLSLTLFNLCRSRMSTVSTNNGSTQSSSTNQPTTQSTKSETSTTKPVVSSTQVPSTQPPTMATNTTTNTTSQPGKTSVGPNSTQPTVSPTTQGASATTTQQSKTQPSTTQSPSTTQPPKTQPSTTQPPSQPSTTQAPTTQPPTQPSTTQPPTIQPSSTPNPSTERPTEPTTPTTQSTSQLTASTTSNLPTERPTPKSNTPTIIQSAIDRFYQFENRINQLRDLINSALQQTQSNYGNIIDIDVISISDTVVNAGRNVRQRIEAVRARFKTNNTVLACYNKSVEELTKLTSEENTKTQSCYSKQTAIIGFQVASSINLEIDLNAKQLANGAVRLAECASSDSQLTDELVTQCVEQILNSIDEYLTTATNEVQKLLDESKDMLDVAIKCVQDGFTTVKTVSLNILDSFKNCTGINA